MKSINNILSKLYNNISNDKLKKDVIKIAKILNKKRVLMIDINSLEELVGGKEVGYEDYIGNISIDKL